MNFTPSAQLNTRRNAMFLTQNFPSLRLRGRASYSSSSDSEINTRDSEHNVMEKPLKYVTVPNNNTRAKKPDNIETFLNNVSTAVSSAVANVSSEAKSMADDMHTIITTDIDQEGQHDEKSATLPKVKGNHPSNAPYVAKPTKKRRTFTFLVKSVKESSTIETREDETNVDVGQQTSSRQEAEATETSSAAANVVSEAMSMADDMHTIMSADIDDDDSSDETDSYSDSSLTARSSKVKGNHPSKTTYVAKLKKRTATFSAKTMKESSTFEAQDDEINLGQPTSSRIEAKGSPATLGMLTKKLHIKRMQARMLRQQLEKIKQEEVETRLALAKPMEKTFTFSDNPMSNTFETREDEINFCYINSRMEAKGSPATSIMLMAKFDMMEKQAKKLRQQLEKIKQEEVETRKFIWAQASGYSS